MKETRKHGETERTSGLEDEQKEGIKRQSRHSKRENVELVEVNVKSSEIGSFKSESTQIFNDKVFSGEVKKQEEGERTFIKKKKKGDSKHDLVKNVVFENKGEYVKGERKGRKSIIKSKRIFKKKKDTFKKDNKKKKHGKNRCSIKKEIKKGECPKNTREDTQKRKN